MKGGAYMFDKAYLKKMQRTDIESCEKNSLTDIKSINIEADKRQNDKINAFIERVGNPYLLKVGEMVVEVEYSGKRSFSEAITSLLSG